MSVGALWLKLNDLLSFGVFIVYHALSVGDPLASRSLGELLRWCIALAREVVSYYSTNQPNNHTPVGCNSTTAGS